jgi:neutral amino acid transport system permease protein
VPPVRASLGVVRLAGGLVVLALASVLGTLLLASPSAGAQEPPTTTTTEQPRESIGGRIRDPEGEPIEDVRLTVRQDGEEVGDDETDEDGNWLVEVPGPGTYEVELDTRTLPEGVSLRNPDRSTLANVGVRPLQQKKVLFPTSTGGGGGPGGGQRLERFVDLAANGVKLGSIIALASIGLSLIFGVTGLVNFAHGELVTFGALVAYFFNASAVMGWEPGWPLVVGGVVALPLGAGLGLGLERGLWRPLRRRRTGNVSLIVVSIGLSLLIRHLYLVVFGGAPRSYTDYAVQRSYEVGPISMPPKDFVITAASLAVLLAVGVLLQHTRTGTAMRAVADNPELASSSGIDVEYVILVTWGAGAALAAVSGIFFGVTESVQWDMGFTLLLTMFAAVILGGLGSAYGAMVGGLVIGVVQEVSTYWFPTEFKVVFALGALILVLLVRPQGILGVRERVG